MKKQQLCKGDRADGIPCQQITYCSSGYCHRHRHQHTNGHKVPFDRWKDQPYKYGNNTSEVDTVKCDYCESVTEYKFPPTKQAHNRAAVRVNGSISILLPEHITKFNNKNVADEFSINASDYCSLSCFLNVLYEKIPWDRVKFE